MLSPLLAVDAPKISCYSSEALIGDKNVHLSCQIRAKPRLSALFWIIDGNGTALAEGEVVNGHWTLVMVNLLIIVVAIVIVFIKSHKVVTSKLVVSQMCLEKDPRHFRL